MKTFRSRNVAGCVCVGGELGDIDTLLHVPASWLLAVVFRVFVKLLLHLFEREINLFILKKKASVAFTRRRALTPARTRTLNNNNRCNMDFLAFLFIWRRDNNNSRSNDVINILLHNKKKGQSCARVLRRRAGVLEKALEVALEDLDSPPTVGLVCSSACGGRCGWTLSLCLSVCLWNPPPPSYCPLAPVILVPCVASPPPPPECARLWLICMSTGRQIWMFLNVF